MWQALEGLTATDFREAGLNAESVFKHAVAKIVSSLQPGDIRIKSIADDFIVISSAAAVQDPPLSFRARSQVPSSGAPLHTVLYRVLQFLRSGSARAERPTEQPQSAYVSVCVITYGIKFSTKEGGYPNGDVAYAEVSAQLASAVADKSFDAYLHQYALIYTERVLQDAHTPDSSDALYSTYTVEDRAQTDDNPSDTRPQGLSTTGVLLVVLFTALTVLGCVFCWSYRGKLTGGRYAELGSESTHNLDPSQAGQSQRDNSPRSSRPSLARLAASSILGRRILRTGNGSPHGGSEGGSGRDEAHSRYGTVGSASEGTGQQRRRGHRFTIEEEDDDAMETIHLHDEETGGRGPVSPPPSAPLAPPQKQQQKQQGATESGVDVASSGAGAGEIELATVSHNPLVAGQDEEYAGDGV